MREETSSLLVLLNLGDRTAGLWFCFRQQVTDSLEDFDRALDELQETLEVNGVTYPLLWEFITTYGDAWSWVSQAAAFLDWCCVQRWYREAAPPAAMHVFSFIRQFCRLCDLITPLLDLVTGALDAGPRGPLPRESAAPRDEDAQETP